MKKWTSLFLAICMLVSMMPVSIAEEFFADDSFFAEESFAGDDLFFGEEFFEEEIFMDDDFGFEDIPDGNVFEETLFIEDSNISITDDISVGEEERETVTDGETVALETSEEDIISGTATEGADESEEETEGSETGVEDGTLKEVADATEDKVAEEMIDATDAQERSIISVSTDEVEEIYTDWRMAPRLKVSNPSDGVVKLTWAQDGLKKLPSYTKYYVYEYNPSTGVSKQIGKAIDAAKKAKTVTYADGQETRKAVGVGATLEITGVKDGKHTYWVRAERNKPQSKGSSIYVETYGAFSLKSNIDVDDGKWKKVSGLSLKASGSDAILTWKAAGRLSGLNPIDFDLNRRFVVKILTTGTQYDNAKINAMMCVTKEQPSPYFTYVSGTYRLTLPGLAGKTIRMSVVPYYNGKKGTTKKTGKVTLATAKQIWKDVLNLKATQEYSDLSVKLQWDVKTTSLPTHYTITGFSTDAKMKLNATTKQYSPQLDSKKSTPITSVECTEIETITETGEKKVTGYHITVIGKVKSATKASFSVLPRKYSTAKKKFSDGNVAKKSVNLNIWSKVQNLKGVQETAALSVKLEWDVKSTSLPTHYTITGFSTDAKMKLNTVTNQYNPQLDSKKTTPITSIECVPLTDGEKVYGYHITVVGKVKGSEKASFKVLPRKYDSKKKKYKDGSEASKTVNLYNYYKTPPIITKVEQVGNNRAAIAFNQRKAVFEGEIFKISGFKTNVKLKMINGQLVDQVKDGTVISVNTTIDSTGKYVFEVVGKTKSIKEDTKLTWKVTPYKSSKAGTAKTKSLTMKPAKSTVILGINLSEVYDIIDDEAGVSCGKADVTFTSVRSDAKFFKVSLVGNERNSSYSRMIELSKSGLTGSVGKVTFEDVVVGETYSIVIETITTAGGRVVDKTKSVAAGKTTRSEAEKALSTEALASVQAAILKGTEKSYYKGETPVVVLAEDGTAVFDAPECLKGEWKTIIEAGSINDMEIIDGVAKIKGLAAGQKNIIRFKKNSDTSDWSDPITVEVYASLKVEPLVFSQTDPVIGENVSASMKASGGTGSYTFRLYDENGKLVQGNSVTAENAGTYNFSFIAEDNALKTVDGKAYGAESTSTALTFSESFELNGVVYKVVNAVEREAVVVKYKGSSATPEVLGKPKHNSTEYNVTEIGENAFAGNKSITSITLPNAITVIGENAFSGCTSLASMTCK